MWVWLWIAFTIFFFLLRAGGAIRSVPLCFFLSAVAGSLVFSLDQLRTVGPAHPLLRLRQVVLVVVMVAVPPLFDPSTAEISNLPRLVVIVVAAVLIIAIWAVDAVWCGWRPTRLVNGFQWVLVAIVIWFAITTLTSVEPRNSFLGRYASYEGLVLLAALAVLTSGLAESFTSKALPALFRVVVAAAVPVLVYGVIQVHDFVTKTKATWDFVQYHNAFRNVFATVGNPNHLGGYLVTILPIGVVTAVMTRHRWVRVAAWAWVVITVLLVLQTEARGAYLAGLAAGVILVVGMLPILRANARTVGLAIGGGLIVAVALVAGGSRFLGAKASTLFQYGAGSSVSQRYGYWSAAIRLAVHHPVVGTGPDTFADTYARYQDATLGKQLGSTYFVNSAHNIFLSWLANEGFPGLLLILALFALGVAWGWRAWRSFRANGSAPADENGGGRIPTDPRRYMAAALVAAFVAYFVQASFDVEQITTLTAMFLVVGLLGLVNRGLWPAATLLSPLAAFRRASVEPDVPSAEEDPDYPLRSGRSGVYGRSSAQARQDLSRLATASVVGLVGLTAVGLTFWRTDAMWRADHQAWLATQTSLVRATSLNPWEPSYYETLGRSAVATYSGNPHASDALQIVQAGVGYLHHVVTLDGYNSANQAQYGAFLQVEAKVEHNNKALFRQALAALRLAQQENPYNSSVPPLIKQVETSLASG